jgi:YD repeat-containing protein
VLSSGNKVTYNNYNSVNELLSITQTGYTFDPSGNLKQYAYTTSYSYDNLGNIIGMTDANGNTTTYSRDSMGNISSITNALNQTTYYSNYDNMGHAGAVTDPNGNVSNITYNWRGQVASITQKNASSTGTDLTTGFSFDVKGILSKVTYPSGAILLIPMMR